MLTNTYAQRDRSPPRFRDDRRERSWACHKNCPGNARLSSLLSLLEVSPSLQPRSSRSLPPRLGRSSPERPRARLRQRAHPNFHRRDRPPHFSFRLYRRFARLRPATRLVLDHLQLGRNLPLGLAQLFHCSVLLLFVRVAKAPRCATPLARCSDRVDRHRILSQRIISPEIYLAQCWLSLLRQCRSVPRRIA